MFFCQKRFNQFLKNITILKEDFNKEYKFQRKHWFNSSDLPDSSPLPNLSDETLQQTILISLEQNRLGGNFWLKRYPLVPDCFSWYRGLTTEEELVLLQLLDVKMFLKKEELKERMTTVRKKSLGSVSSLSQGLFYPGIYQAWPSLDSKLANEYEWDKNTIFCADEGEDLQDNFQLDLEPTELKHRTKQWQREGKLWRGAWGAQNLPTGDQCYHEHQ